MFREPKLGILLVLLQTQFLANVGLLALAFFGAFVIGFSQLPGGLWDVAASRETETHLRAISLHVVLIVASALHLWWLRADDRRSRYAAVAHAAASVLTLPFALFVALLAGWHRDADWSEAREYAAKVTGRNRLGIMVAWTITVALSSAFAFGAYIAILSGTPWIGLMLLGFAIAAQATTYWMIARHEPKTKLQTYGSPLPGLPDWADSR